MWLWLFTPNSVTSNDYSSFKYVKALKYVSAYNLILTGAFSDIKLFVNKINPVSYTHLDVYKRQVILFIYIPR